MVQKKAEKERAIALRKRGLSYREILVKVPVAKSTLSLWLRSVGLSKRQKQRLTEKKLAAMKRSWEKSHQLRLQRWRDIKKRASREVKNLTSKERWLLGTALYWAEGAKEKEYSSSTDIKFSNSDPAMIIVFQKWLNEFLKPPPNLIRYELYIHKKANWKEARKFWSSKLNIPAKYIHIYFKRHNSKPKRKNVNANYYGLIRICVNGTINFVRKIDGWTQGIYKHWGVV